jgi:mercuric ion transport protein
VLSAVLSSLPLSCCAFPTTFSLLAVGGMASATALMPYRPYLIVLTFLFLGAGFYFAYWPQSEHRRPSITCAPVKSRTLQRASLWAVTLATIGLIAFPYLLPYF